MIDMPNDPQEITEDELFADERHAEFGPEEAMGEAEFKTAFSLFAQSAIRALLTSGEAPPMVFLPTFVDGSIVRLGAIPVGDFLGDADSKNALASLMERLLANPNHDLVVLSHEAWTVSVAAKPGENPLADAAAMGSLAEHPDRQEALFFLLRSRQTQAVCFLPILRAPDGSVASIGEGELIFSSADGSSVSGRFAGTPPKRTLH